MNAGPPPPEWTLRPSLLTERMIGVALVLVTAAAGLTGMLLLVNRPGMSAWSALIPLLTVAAALFAGLWVSRRFTRGLTRLGVFGKARFDGGALRVGRRHRIDLSRPFELETRCTDARVRPSMHRSFFPGLRSEGYVKGAAFRVRVLELRIVQDGRWVNLIGESTDFQPGPDYTLAGLPIIEAWPVPPRSGYRRLWAADLAAILRVLVRTPGWRPARLPDGRPPRSDDPRAVYCPEWKTALAALLVLAAILLPFYLYLAWRGSGGWELARARAVFQQAAEATGKDAGSRWYGRRVTHVDPEGNRLTGKVAGVTLSEGASTWDPIVLTPLYVDGLEVEVENVTDAGGQPFPAYHPPLMVNGVPAEKGKTVHLYVRQLSGPPSGSAPVATPAGEGLPAPGEGTAAVPPVSKD